MRKVPSLMRRYVPKLTQLIGNVSGAFAHLTVPLNALLLATVVLLAAATARADVVVTLHDGKEVRTASVTYERNTLKLADGRAFPRDRVKRIALIHEQPGGDGESRPAEPAQDVKELLASAAKALKRFPDARMITLVDHGIEEKRADGTWFFRYRTAAQILHPDMLTMATGGFFFDDERERVRIVQARSIDPDGTVHEYDPASIKTTDPAREDVFFGRGKRMTYQIPGVRVGSIVDYTHEREVFNPYDPEMFFPAWYFASEEPFVHSEIRIVMPRDQELYYTTRNMPPEARKPRVIHGHGTKTYVWIMENQPGVIKEPSMAPIGDVVPYLECSPFADWSSIKNWASERLLPRMKETEELKKVVAEQTKGLTEPQEKVAALYYYVQNYIQYISIKGSIASGLCGHPASETLANKYGDCIDCAILFATLLRIAGIEAYPVWVNTNDSTSIATDIPTLGGNHAITEIHLGNKVFFLDPTAAGYRYPALRWDDHGVHAINPILARTVPVPVPDPSEEMNSTDFAVTLLPEGDAWINFLSLRTGSWEADARDYFIRYSEQKVRKDLQSIVNSYSPGAGAPSCEVRNAHDLFKPLKWHMEWDAPDYAVAAGDLLIFRIPGLSYSFPEAALERRKYDIDYKTSHQAKHRVTVNIPEGYTVKYMPPDIELSTKYITYKASCKEQDGTIIFEDNLRQMTRFVPVADYPAHRQTLRKIARHAKEHIFFQKK